MLRICKYDSYAIIRFEILLRLYGWENFSGPSRNGPLVVYSPKGTPMSKGGRSSWENLDESPERSQSELDASFIWPLKAVSLKTESTICLYYIN